MMHPHNRSRDHRRRLGQAAGIWHILSNAVDTTINAGSGATLDDLPLSTFTAELWMKAATWGEGGAYSFLLNKTAGWAPGWYFYIQDGHGLVAIVDCATTNAESRSGSDDFTPDNLWHHIAFTFDGTALPAGNPVVRIWKDGEEIPVYATQNAGVGDYQSDVAQDLLIGYKPGGGNTFDGALGWSRLSNSLRYTAAFTPDARTAPPDADANTVEQWNMNEGSGTTAAALVTSPANDATITNGTWNRA